MKSNNRSYKLTICAFIAATMIAPMTIAEEVSSEKSPSAPSGESEVKAAPGAIHMVWKGKDTTEPEIAAMVDKQKVFNMNNAGGDPSVKAVANRTSRWTGILNVEAAGLYTFNVVYSGARSNSTMSLSINGVSVTGFTNNGTGSKNVQLPGPANIEVTLYSEAANRGDNVLIRYKKAGTLAYTTISPETLYHAVK